MKMEVVRQKTEKDVAILTTKVSENNNKAFVGEEVKRSVKSHLKVYLEELNKCKTDRLNIHELIGKTDKGLQ